MILRTKTAQHAADEAELLKYLIAELGETDAARLARFSWEQSSEPIAYMNAIAHLVRGVGAHGKGFVSKVLEVASKPKEAREAEIDLAVFARAMLIDLTARVASTTPDDRDQLAAECWLELNHRLRERLNGMFPGRPDYIVNGALIAGTEWDRAAGTFGVNVVKLIEGMKQKDPLA